MKQQKKQFDDSILSHYSLMSVTSKTNKRDGGSSRNSLEETE